MYAIAPTALPNTDRIIRTPGFWIGRHPCPDKVILSAREVERVNRVSQDELKLIVDLAGFPAAVSGPELAGRLKGGLAKFERRTLYTETGRVATKAFCDNIRSNLNLGRIPDSVPVQFGFVLRFADQRLLPTAAPLYTEPGDINFDEVQNSGLDAATAVAILHRSTDGKWLYVESSLSPGWVRADRIVRCSRGDVRRFLAAPAFAVVIRPKADLFLNESRTDHYDHVRMGVRLPIVRKAAETVAVQIPFTDSTGKFTLKTAFMHTRDVHEGFRPYTARVILEQAFELLNAPYGWGDMHGEQDCSRFLQMIFATTGLALPRNSSEQAQVGRLIGEFPPGTPAAAKLPILLNQGVPGITLLQVKNPGHIVLYLGHVADRPYVIHETWGYRQRCGLADTVRAVNRVAVTDLFLGGDSAKGSILDRTVRIQVLD